jgi:hypothetical protein
MKDILLIIDIKNILTDFHCGGGHSVRDVASLPQARKIAVPIPFRCNSKNIQNFKYFHILE